ncbi:hypothetical protein N7492_005209 [Penicillium capsulatum]|uniref:ATP-dependent protease n=1 Tax=Penicillium capsulatum TaxID=69766 RepID=A0A9W9LRG0_9EURO|nr:hypothetical protein N7492_005209 [Penicillium capsulatum]KAJ6135686.1 hypothetical protein N7512_000846 [Penicillium capsulatum]
MVDATPTASAESDSVTASHTPTDEHDSRTLDVLPHLVVRLIQCRHCSRPLQGPRRLPCGNTLCRDCLPPVRRRTGITYPIAEDREEGFTCYWEGTDNCAGEHCVGDCSADVVLSCVASVFEEELAWPMSGAAAQDDDYGRSVHWKPAHNAGAVVKPRWSQLGQRGWLHGIYQLAHTSQFPCDASDVVYEDAELPQGQVQQQRLYIDEDCIRYLKLRRKLRAELDCQVCYALILEPLTLPCGHTFCRSCVARILDHSDLCPICRRKSGMPTAIDSEPMNQTLARLIDYFFPDQVAARRETMSQDDFGMDREKNLPLFICTLSFPTMPTFLHIFEPRYRLMIRRVVENGDGKFGMVMYNRRGRVQGGEMGSVPFMQYGTLLIVERYELLPDGRSLVIATGISRFKVIESNMLDGYHVAKTERVDDIPLAEEERIEATETAAAAIPDLSASPVAPLDSMSTQDLLHLTRDFIRNQRQAGAPWLHPRVMLAYGPVPTDAARFPWWFASILPIAEEEKYPILSATSVRGRLKISARWARQLEARDCRPSPDIVHHSSRNDALFSFLPRHDTEQNGQIQPNQQELDHQQEDLSTDTYIPQTLVVGAFLAIFLAQVGVNFLQVVRTGRRQRRQAMELQFPQPLPQQDRARNWESEEVRNNTE